MLSQVGDVHRYSTKAARGGVSLQGIRGLWLSGSLGPDIKSGIWEVSDVGGVPGCPQGEVAGWVIE